MKARRICVVTGSRADYGLLRYTLEGLRDRSTFELQIVATGMHLSPEFGLTEREIENDGFRVDARVEMLLSSDTPVGTAKSIGLGTIGFADVLDRLRPDLLLVLGDRFEILAAVQAALVARIPVAHVQGGETTEGSFDEAIRHGVTKMSHLHFTATEVYRQRVIQLGEDPDRVFNVGALGVDAIHKLKLMGLEGLERKLNFRLTPRTILATFHPATLDPEPADRDMRELLQALDAFPETQVVLTKSNADFAGRAINRLIDSYSDSQPDRVHAAASLGQETYLSLMRVSSVVVGNSSSGLIEAPALRVPTVNVGNRQKGRLSAPSVIHCDPRAASIEEAVSQAMSDEFRAEVEDLENPYGQGGGSNALIDVLESVDLSGITLKRFHDLPSSS